MKSNCAQSENGVYETLIQQGVCPNRIRHQVRSNYYAYRQLMMVMCLPSSEPIINSDMDYFTKLLLLDAYKKVSRRKNVSSGGVHGPIPNQ